MKRNQIILIAIAAFIGLWMFSQSGNASPVNNDGNYSHQVLNHTTL